MSRYVEVPYSRDGRTTLTPGLVQFLPAGHVGNLHIPRIDSSTENNGGTVCARSPHLKTPKLSCLPNDVNYHQIETKMAFRFTSGGVYDDLTFEVAQ